jgi:hypothetical protein
MKDLYRHAARRAFEKGLPCDLRLKYVLVANPPKRCACCSKRLDYSIGRGQNKQNSPSIDRWNNQKGYTLDNVRVICYRCNRLKGDGTRQEFQEIVRYMR